MWRQKASRQTECRSGMSECKMTGYVICMIFRHPIGLIIGREALLAPSSCGNEASVISVIFGNLCNFVFLCLNVFVGEL